MQDKWLEQLGKFEKAIINCPLEGMGAMNDYLRVSGISFGKSLIN